MSWSHSFHGGHVQRVDHLLAPVAVATTCLSLGLGALGVWGDRSRGTEPETADFLAVAGLTVMSAVVVFGLVLPQVLHRREAGGVALVLGLVALLTLPVFWLGVTGVVGVAAALLGIEHRHDEQHARHARTGAALGAVAAAGYVLMYLLDWARTPGAW